MASADVPAGPHPYAGRGHDRRRERRDRRPRRAPLTIERIVDAAFEIMASEGYEAVTMRRVAQQLGTGPASLYAHLDNKRELDALVVDRVAREVVIPDPDPARWQQQILQVGRDLRAAMLRHPGVARAVMGYVPTGEEAVTSSERILAILLAGGIHEQVAAWACDLLPLYVTAVAFEESVVERETDLTKESMQQWISDLRGYFESLPAARFPNIVAHANALTTGDREVRFDFGLRVIVAGIAAVSSSWPATTGESGG